MPRLTHYTYINQCEYLRRIWRLDNHEFALLKPEEQWDLHRFYTITEDITDAELRLHRRLVGQVDPSLPQRAGRAYAKLERRDWSRAGTISAGKKERVITVRSVVKPTPDPRLYARVLVQLAAEQQGLTKAWTRPELDALLAKFSSDGGVGDTKVSSKPRQ